MRNFCIQLAVPLAVLAILVATPMASAQAQQWGGDEVDVDLDDSRQDEDDSADDDADSESDDEADQSADGDEDRARQPARAVAPRPEVTGSLERQLDNTSRRVHIYQLAEEIIDEVIADISHLNVEALTPAAVRQMTVTPNLSEDFGQFVESTLITAMATHTDVQVKRCVACNAMRSRVDDGDWVVTRGLVHHEDLRAEAERLGVKTFLDARFSFYPGANIVAMQVELFRADDGAVLWSETYRSDATTAAILRTGDRVQTRAERVGELERKLEARPYYGHQLVAGFGYIPYDSPQGGLGGGMIGYRLYEKFGQDNRYMFGIGADGFFNMSDEGILGTFLYGLFQVNLLPPNLNSLTLRTGPAIGGFFAGTEGNSFVGEWTLDTVLQFRLGAGASVFYFLPTEFAGYDLGGFGIKGRISFNW